MRIHLPCLPHTNTTEDYIWCAYTAKLSKFSTMMSRAGHDVILYGGPLNTAICYEHVEVVTADEQGKWFGHYDWSKDVFDGFQVGAPWWEQMNEKAIEEIRLRAQPGDFLGIIAGWCQKPIADAFPEMLPCEWGIGYSGVFADFRVYESYAWMHHLMARESTDDIRYYDAVIPNYFDLNDFTPSYAQGDYLLFLGRHTPRKGLAIVQEITNRTSLPVLTAGQGDARIDGATYCGVVTGKAKQELLAGAKALLAPTTYLEPFGGVAVEAMLSGTPAITTDYGAFTETVEHGVSGFRCRLLKDFMEAIDRVDSLNRYSVEQHAHRYSLESIAPLYSAYFSNLNSLRGQGWYELV